MATFKAAQPELTTAARTSVARHDFNLQHVLRDQFTLTTWLALGALAQLLLIALPLKRYYAALPVAAYLTLTLADHALMLVGWRRNRYAAAQLPGRTTALLPSADGAFRASGAASEPLTVLHLGVKNYHPAGLLAPGAAAMAAHARVMFDELSERAEEFGFMGMDGFVNSSASAVGSQQMVIMYFRSRADVHRYAESPLHRKAWDWYNRFCREHGHMGVMHELYEAPAGQWENVSINMEPNGLGVTRHRVVTPDGAERWISPLVDASKGKLVSTHGRLG